MIPMHSRLLYLLLPFFAFIGMTSSFPMCTDGQTPLMESNDAFRCIRGCPQGFVCEFQDPFNLPELGVCCANMTALVVLYGDDPNAHTDPVWSQKEADRLHEIISKRPAIKAQFQQPLNEKERFPTLLPEKLTISPLKSSAGANVEITGQVGNKIGGKKSQNEANLEENTIEESPEKFMAKIGDTATQAANIQQITIGKSSEVRDISEKKATTIEPEVQKIFICARQKYMFTCKNETLVTQPTIRWYFDMDTKSCEFYPWGFCPGDRIVESTTLRTLEDCEQHCLENWKQSILDTIRAQAAPTVEEETELPIPEETAGQIAISDPIAEGKSEGQHLETIPIAMEASESSENSENEEIPEPQLAIEDPRSEAKVIEALENPTEPEETKPEENDTSSESQESEDSASAENDDTDSSTATTTLAPSTSSHVQKVEAPLAVDDPISEQKYIDAETSDIPMNVPYADSSNLGENEENDVKLEIEDAVKKTTPKHPKISSKWSSVKSKERLEAKARALDDNIEEEESSGEATETIRETDRAEKKSGNNRESETVKQTKDNKKSRGSDKQRNKKNKKTNEESTQNEGKSVTTSIEEADKIRTESLSNTKKAPTKKMRSKNNLSMAAKARVKCEKPTGYRFVCPSGRPSQFVYRWELIEGKCQSFPYGYCWAEMNHSHPRDRAECEKHCMIQKKTEEFRKLA